MDPVVMLVIFSIIVLILALPEEQDRTGWGYCAVRALGVVLLLCFIVLAFFRRR